MVSRNTFLSAIEANDRPDLRRFYADWLEEQGDSKHASRQRETADEMETRWHFTGDVNLEYGGSFIDLSTWRDGYCSAVRVTDLDSACGFTGACLIEHAVINGVTDTARVRQAMRYAGLENGFCRGMSKLAIRHAIAEALMSYGYADPDDGWDGYQSGNSETVQTEANGPMVFDGWKADKRLRGTTLEAYVKSVHLEE